tara:strand:- start:747 stop:1031 length:285 start_codon:yes stop_codon:yes gene_type:complete
MTIETTVFTFQISNTFEEWSKIFDSPEIDEFHKTVGLSPLFRGKGLTDPKEVIVIHQAEEGVAKHIFSDPETIKNIEGGGHIYSTTKITSWLSD